MDNTSYVIEVKHSYEGGTGGESKQAESNVKTSVNKRVRIAKQVAFASAAATIGIVKSVGQYTGDYGLSRGLGNAMKGAGLALSFSNPYTAAMTVMGALNTIARSETKRRDNNLRAATLKQISGGINNNYRGRKL